QGRFASFAVVQEAGEGYPTLRSHRVAIGCYTDDGTHLVRTGRVELDVTGARTEVPALVGTARPDLVLLNDDDLTYAPIRLDEAALSTLRRGNSLGGGIGRIAESLPRALCWAAVWDMTREAEWGARDYVTLVLDNIDAETDVTVVVSLHANLLTALNSYV